MVVRAIWGRVWLAVTLCACAAGLFAQAEGCEPWVAKVLSVQGPVEVERGGATPDGSAKTGRPQWRAVEGDETLCPGDNIRVGPLGRAAVQLADEVQTVLRLDERTTLSFPPREPEAPPWLDLLQGVMHFITRVPRRLQIHTPFVNAAVEGTELVLRVGEAETELIVFEGRVRFENAAGALVVASREAALARAGEVPVRRVLVKPREAVEWALYYPPLIDLQLIARQPERYSPALREAASAYRRNDLAGAFAALERVPQEERGGSYFLLQATLFLSVGRVRKAEGALAAAERADPKSGGIAALRSVIALVRDQKDEALRLAQAGAMLDPRSPLPESALSYAYQGRFEIERALEHASRAVDLSPEDALLWARVSEVELSRGDLDAALEAAKKAEALNPALARTQTVLGFAYLTRIEVKRAKEAFEHAIEGDPADPLPRLGMGLAKIRDGDLEGGTREIETAASLDPNNSLVRSYLGKAYYEQKRDGLASSEYEQAKLLDPEDPTPWFYDAIQKQTTNRPVEALHDLDRAITLNDNRAVYRSRLLLDQDLAARSAAIGRIYSDLGFEQRALVEGWRSVNTDPSDYSGHRLLADSYGAVPRHEIARVSELLQSQLLQPINLTPIQPQLAESNLLLVEGQGPSAPAFNELNALFVRDRITLQPSFVFGDDGVFGEEVTQSGLWGKFSYSLGQLHFETDGIRENNDLEQDLYNAFVQADLAPSLSAQVEFRRRETEHGDLGFRFDPEDFSSSSRRVQSAETYRAGVHYQPRLDSDVIVSLSYSGNDQLIDGSSAVGVEAYNAEAQYLLKAGLFHLTAGGGINALSSEATTSTSIGAFNQSVNVQHGNAYLYSSLDYPQGLTWIAGASFDALDQGSLGDVGVIDQANPKLGLIWDISPRTTVRAAGFRVLKRTLINDQTIEPTQIAGFNQFFDDPNATESRRYGLAVDHVFSSALYGGVEISKRDLKVPTSEGEAENWEEDLYRGYLFWTPHPDWATALSFEHETFNRQKSILSGLAPDTDTDLVPWTLSYFSTTGLFGRLRTTFVHQRVEQEVDSYDNSDFFLVDLGVGFRLPKRYGILSLEVRNLFDREFAFQGDNLRSSQVLRPSPFLPETSIIAQIVLSF
ncbi:MAG: FecR domain-containing protein [Gammaproteobacteria bacterium]